eukprot:6207472-Pleurochrysis_carterae.AAC.5
MTHVHRVRSITVYAALPCLGCEPNAYLLGIVRRLLQLRASWRFVLHPTIDVHSFTPCATL